MIRTMKPVMALIALGAATSLSRVQLSPVSRVVELLESMSVRLDKDHKAEEDLYETFVCWATSIISQKNKANAAADARMSYLSTYVDDLSNGRIELTGERVDLEKEIETLSGDLEVASQTRLAESKGFEMAKEEMDQAIAALEKAIEVLHTATKEHTTGVLLGLRGSLSEGFAARSKEGAALTRAVELGKKVLTKGDAVFLQRLLTGEVPDRASWKKLNRKATFKMDYKARSFKIQGVLAQLLENIATDLEEAAKKEQGAVKSYVTLKTAKETEKSAAQIALSKMDKENGARALTVDESNAELRALNTQVQNDKAYIAQVQTALDKKKAEWKTRQELRTGEQAAISKAISILHSGESRDLFKKSFASQGFLFLQESASDNAKVSQVRRLLERTVHASREQQKLIAILKEGQFDAVIAAIDSLLTTLRTEEAEDLTKKEACESDRTTDTRSAIKTSREMDDLSDDITALKAKIAEIAKEIAEKKARVVELVAELKKISDMRADENAEYVQAKKDDQEAAVLVENAKNTISLFYTKNGLMLSQSSKSDQPFTSTAGEAPPPPPPTWKDPYGGRTDESTGIIAIMEMIHDDILKDVAKADAEEADAVALYTETKTSLETEKGLLETSIDELTTDEANKKTDVVTNSNNRGLKKGELDIVMKKIADAEPGCDFISINFLLRSQNRKIEIDGLTKAKAILKGGTFDALPDPNREIKPGDALVQSHAVRKFLSRSIA